MAPDPFASFCHLWEPTLGWQPSPSMERLFAHLYACTLEGNKTQNLTRITDAAEFWEKHLWDSLRGIRPYLGLEGIAAIDIGTGAGFPGLPAAIANPTWQVTLLDSRHKKTAYLAATVQTLQTHGPLHCHVLTARAEAIAQEPACHDRFDLALVRAVGDASLCATYALPFLRSGGTAVLYRGQWTAEEERALQRACQPYHATIRAIESFDTPISHSIRHGIHVQKQDGENVRKNPPKTMPRPVRRSP